MKIDTKITIFGEFSTLIYYASMWVSCMSLILFFLLAIYELLFPSQIKDVEVLYYLFFAALASGFTSFCAYLIKEMWKRLDEENHTLSGILSDLKILEDKCNGDDKMLIGYYRREIGKIINTKTINTHIMHNKHFYTKVILTVIIMVLLSLFAYFWLQNNRYTYTRGGKVFDKWNKTFICTRGNKVIEIEKE